MALNLVSDRTIRGKIYPAFARHQAEPYTQAWREFEQHWPCTVPLRLQEYCEHHGVEIAIHNIHSYPPGSFYVIALGFFDFAIDYFAMLPDPVFAAVFSKELKILFYYHEGDNPGRIKQHLDALATANQLHSDCYRFVSGNTAAGAIPGFVYFCDFELWYWHRNEHTPPTLINTQPREQDFTCLNRTHKTWRATAMADLLRKYLLENSYWSYCETGDIEDEDNPIEIDAFENLRQDTQQFLDSAPYYSDTMTQAQRNNHSEHEPKYYANAYCNIVMETHFDADGSGGTFLTEKTYKPIKHAQLFFIAGPPGSLQLLRDLGYRTFDNILDNRYDDAVTSTERWNLLCKAIADAKPRLPELFAQARSDIEHNQQLFLSRKTQRLNILLEQLNESY